MTRKPAPTTSATQRVCHLQRQVPEVVKAGYGEDEALLAGDTLQLTAHFPRRRPRGPNHADPHGDDGHSGVDDQPGLGDGEVRVHV